MGSRRDLAGLLPAHLYEESVSLVSEWKERWRCWPRPYLRYVKTWEAVSIHDRRGDAPRSYRFDGRMSALYEECADAKRTEDLLSAFDGDAVWVTSTLQGFLEKDLMVRLDGQYLSLALPENPYH